MIIIVEGIDRVGKTHLIQKMCNRYGWTPFHDDFRYMPTEDKYSDRLVNVEKTNTVVNLMEQGLVNDVVFDRFHMTEYVYSYHTRNVPQNFSTFESLDKRIGALDNVWLVLVEPTDIERSSREHGCDLSGHQKTFDYLYGVTAIKNKLMVKRIGEDSYDVIEYGDSVWAR